MIDTKIKTFKLAAGNGTFCLYIPCWKPYKDTGSDSHYLVW